MEKRKNSRSSLACDLAQFKAPAFELLSINYNEPRQRSQNNLHPSDSSLSLSSSKFSAGRNELE